VRIRARIPIVRESGYSLEIERVPCHDGHPGCSDCQKSGSQYGSPVRSHYERGGDNAMINVPLTSQFPVNMSVHLVYASGRVLLSFYLPSGGRHSASFGAHVVVLPGVGMATDRSSDARNLLAGRTTVRLA
jgi:hypothetical protein